MMNIQSSVVIGLFQSTMLASVFVSLACISGLSIPVLAVIGLPSAFPHDGFLSAHNFGVSNSSAFDRAKVSLSDVPRPYGKLFFALIAFLGSLFNIGFSPALYGTKKLSPLGLTRRPNHLFFTGKALHGNAFLLEFIKTFFRAEKVFCSLEFARLFYGLYLVGCLLIDNKKSY